MPLVYSVISRGSTVLCSCELEGDFSFVSSSILPNIPVQNDAKTTYTSNNYTFHVMVENGLIFMCAATSDCTRTQCFGFINDIKTRFQDSSLAARAQFAGSNEFDPEFKRVMQQQLEKYSDPAQSDQLGQLQNQVSEVKGIMVQNIDRVLERGENLDTLMATTEELQAHSTTFHKTTRAVRRKYWWKNLKMKLIIAAVVLLILLVLTLVILFSTGVLPVKNDDTSSKHPTTSTIAPSGGR